MYSMLLPACVLMTLSLNAAAATVVKTPYGNVQGAKCPGSASNYFLSLPFANPPIGDLRFEPPQPYNGSYNGTLNATTPSPNCYQFNSGPVLPGTESEDCLYVDIYAPANASSTSQLPVKVWLYGGTFWDGSISDPLYDGCFSSENAIVVTVNYRLGPLGYLALENSPLNGNYGIQDQLQALRWVQDNIPAFGGDSTQVLLFGQSAGATAAFALATLPEIKSLVNAVAMESGGGVTLPTLSTAQDFHQDFLSALNCSRTDLACLRSISPQVMNTTFWSLPTNKTVFVFSLHDYNGAAFPWSPLAGSHMFPRQPSEVGVQVPAIFGSNGLEGSIFVLGTFGAAGAKQLTSADYLDFLTVNFGSFAEKIAKQYSLAIFDGSVFEAMSIVMRDYEFRCTAYRGANLAASKGLPVYTYSFNQTPSCPWTSGLNTDVLPILGATHTAEIPFVFGEVANLPLPNGNCSFSAGERNISAFMQSAWTMMASVRAPGSAWPSYSSNSSKGINFQDGAVSPGIVDYTMCPFWDEVGLAVDRAAYNSSGTANANTSNTNTSAAAKSSSIHLLQPILTAAALLIIFLSM